jgi:hypothetical protein
MRAWWRSLRRPEQVTLIGVLVTLVVGLLGALPAYLIFFTQDGGGSATPTTRVETVGDGPTTTSQLVTDPSDTTATTGEDPPRTLPRCPASLVFGETIRCSIDQQGQVDRYQVAGTRRDRIWMNVVRTSGDIDTYIEMTRPDGNKVTCGGLGTPHTCELDTTGTHAVLVRSFSRDQTGGYHLHVQRLTLPQGCKTLRFGAAPVADSVDAAAAARCYTFTGTEDDRVQVTVVKTSGDMYTTTEVTRPDGNKLACGGLASPSTCALDATGPHTVLVRSHGGVTTGGFQISLTCLTVGGCRRG